MADAAADLEARILADPDDDDAYLVYADWLSQCGDPRGELIMLQRAGQAEAAERHLAAHATALLGPLAKWQRLHPGPLVRWHNGFWRSVGICPALDPPPAEDPLDVDDWYRSLRTLYFALAAHPSARMLRELRASFEGGQQYPGDLFEVMARQPLPALVGLRLGRIDDGDPAALSYDELDRLRDLGGLWSELPDLREISVIGTGFQLGEVRHATLRRLQIKCDDDDRPEVLAVLDGAELPALQRLALHGVRDGAALCARLAASPLAGQLVELDLAGSGIHDEDVEHLIAHRAALGRLARISVSRTYVTAEGVAQLGALGAQVTAEALEDPEEDNFR